MRERLAAGSLGTGVVLAILAALLGGGLWWDAGMAACLVAAMLLWAI